MIYTVNMSGKIVNIRLHSTNISGKIETMSIHI